MDDLIVEFITETTESLSMLDLELVKLEQNPDDAELISSIFRLMHTIKGTCGFLGLPRLEKVAHSGENVLGKIRDGELVATPTAVSLILTSIDRIKELVEFLGSNGSEPEGDDSELIAKLNDFLESGGGTSEEASEESLEHLFKGDIPEDDSVADQPAESHESPAEVVAAAEPPAAPDPTPAPPAIAEAKQKAVDDGLKNEPKEGGAGGGAMQSIRVNLDVLENLMQLVGELVLTRNQLVQISRSTDVEEMTTPLQRLSSLTTELQENVMKTRMQPIGSAWSKFPRLIRDLSMELGKKVELNMIGAETELDRQVMELIKDPLTHMVRNSADHGLERPAERLAAGKSEVGTITLSSYHEGGHIIIEIADDGKGLNIERIRQKALENGITTETELETLTEHQIVQFIFKPGFSTADKVTNVSGRGVGMDVVRSNIEKIGGSIDVYTKLGHGSKFLIKIPLTLAIVSVLVIECCNRRFAIPQITVNELVRIKPGVDNNLEYINSTLVMRHRGSLLPMIFLNEVLEVGNREDYLEKSFYIVVCTVGSQEFGIVVDRIYDTEEIVVKPVAPILKDLDVYSGCTILGDGKVLMILDPNGLARRVGDIQGTVEKDNDVDNRKRISSEKNVTFLVFTSGEDEGPKAVPLEIVSRIEELETSRIEHSGGNLVMQYRDDLMRLICLQDNFDYSNKELLNVIVFSFEGKTVGLAVDEIVDIAQEKLELKMASSDSRFIGSLVLRGKTTDILDVAFVIGKAVAHEQDLSSGDAAQISSKVLLVEDSPFFRNLTAPFLSAAGYKVSTATNALDAVSILESGEYFDAIVTDIEMPGMDGFGLLAKCRDSKYLPNAPIIAYTSKITPESVENGLKLGFADYIAKTDREGLLSALGNALARAERMERVAA